MTHHVRIVFKLYQRMTMSYSCRLVIHPLIEQLGNSNILTG